MSLTQQDVAKLLEAPSPKVRAETTAKIGSHFEAKEFTEKEKLIAEQIFRTLVKDAEIVVREALASSLKAAEDLPRDIARAMAEDVESVSLPVLRFSEVLTDEDLIEILSGDNAAKQEAIALREKVSSVVADAVIDTGNEHAVAKLVSNEGAEITESGFGRVMTRYKDNELISDSMAQRPTLPPSVSEKLMNKLSENLQDYLINQQKMDADQAAGLILQVRERATVSLLKEGSSDEELMSLVKRLQKGGKLTPSLLLRALCSGDVIFFECAMSQLAGIPLTNARKLIHDEGNLGLKSLYKKAGLLMGYYPAVEAAIKMIDEMDYDGELNDRKRFMGKLVERVLTQFEIPDQEISPHEIEYLIKKLDQYAA